MSVLASTLRRGNAATERMSATAAAFASITLIVLMIVVVVDVTLRDTIAAPIPGASESTELLLPYIVFWSLAYTLLTGGHVRVSILVARLPERTRVAAEILACVIGLVLFGALTYTSWLQFWESFVIQEFMMAAVKLPWWVGKFGMPTGCFLMFLQFLFLLLRYARVGGLESPRLVEIVEGVEVS